MVKSSLKFRLEEGVLLVILLSFLAGAGDWSYDPGTKYGKGWFNYSIFAGFPFS